jgi:Fic family protein
MPEQDLTPSQRELAMAETMRPVQIEQAKCQTEKKKAPESREQRDHRLAVADVISDPELSARTALEALESIDVTFEEEEDPREQMASVFSDYGLDPGEVTPKVMQRLTLLANSVSRMRSESAQHEAVAAVQRKLHEQMANLALQKIDRLNSFLSEKDPDPAKIEETLVDAMETMGKLAKRLDPSDEKDDVYRKRIMERFNSIVEAKTKAGREIRRVFGLVMDRFSDFIEDEIVTRKLQEMAARRRSISMERAIQEIYGHSKEEMEEIKARNREKVVDEMEKMAEEPYVTTEMLLKLYQVNNRGVAPKAYSRLREKPGELVSFGRRVGTLPEQVAEEMKDFDARVAGIIDRSITEGWSDARYQIAVAKLHNELLEIHPFPDRNGSTSVLFMEMMMMRRGYKPPKKREKDYYKNITRILGYNPTAVAVIYYEMRRQKNEFGYFAGRTVQGGQEQLYDILLKLAHPNTFKGKKVVVRPSH